QRLVERLLQSPRYAANFTNYFRDLILPDPGGNFEFEALVPGFEAWMREQLKKNAGYDQIVRDIVALPITDYNVEMLFRNPYQVHSTPYAFYLGAEAKPENLAASTARLFLGVRL